MDSRQEERKQMVFHHPVPLMADPGKGSQLRPKRMLDAFKSLGFEVIEVTGYSKERIPLMKSLARDIRSGRRIDFCYSECVTSPTALSDPNHLPLHPLADPIFFNELRRAGIPSGLYYRDVHWRFSQYRDVVSIPKRAVANVFYKFDLAWYAKLVDVVYLPDLAMADAIPRSGRFTFEALPPGTVVEPPDTDEHRSEPEQLRLIYIGSVTPPHNDVAPLLRAVAKTHNATLTISCPEAETQVLSSYPADLLRDVEVVHFSSDQMSTLYQRADITCLVYSPHPYRDFAMPVKLFESIGQHVPCVTNADTAAGRFVAEHGIGWTIRDESELQPTLSRLAGDRSLLTEKRSQLFDSAPSHGWDARAAKVASDLEGHSG